MYLNFINVSRSNVHSKYVWSIILLVQSSSRWKPTAVSSQLTIVPRFQWGVTPSRIGLWREYAKYENGLLWLAHYLLDFAGLNGLLEAPLFGQL